MSAVRPLVKAMSPVLRVNDLQVAADYYRDVLGFEVTWTWGDPSSRAGVARDGFEVQLAAEYGPAGPPVVYFQVAGVDAYYQRCLERGGQHRDRAGCPAVPDARFSGAGSERQQARIRGADSAATMTPAAAC